MNLTRVLFLGHCGAHHNAKGERKDSNMTDQNRTNGSENEAEGEEVSTPFTHAGGATGGKVGFYDSTSGFRTATGVQSPAKDKNTPSPA